MRNWGRQALKVAVKSAIPFEDVARSVKRRISPYRGNALNEPGLLASAVMLVKRLHDAGIALHGATVAEIGTGWFPVISQTFIAAGAQKVITVDKSRLLDIHTFNAAQALLRERLEKTCHKHGADPAWFDLSRLPQNAPDLETACAIAHIDYRPKFDFNTLPNASCDICISRTVLEHIPVPWLENMFRNTRRILKPSGVMLHEIDMSDHFEHFDHTISKVNFLQYEDRTWSVLTLGTSELFTNRLRFYEYEKMMQAAGFTIEAAFGAPHPQTLEDLRSLKLCSRYAGQKLEDLAIISGTLLARNVTRPQTAPQ